MKTMIAQPVHATAPAHVEAIETFPIEKDAIIATALPVEGGWTAR